MKTLIIAATVYVFALAIGIGIGYQFGYSAGADEGAARIRAVRAMFIR